MPEQHSVTSTLAELPALAAAAGLRPPVTLVIGPVVELGEPSQLARVPALARTTHPGHPSGPLCGGVCRDAVRARRDSRW